MYAPPRSTPHSVQCFLPVPFALFQPFASLTHYAQLLEIELDVAALLPLLAFLEVAGVRAEAERAVEREEDEAANLLEVLLPYLHADKHNYAGEINVRTLTNQSSVCDGSIIIAQAYVALCMYTLQVTPSDTVHAQARLNVFRAPDEKAKRGDVVCVQLTSDADGANTLSVDLQLFQLAADLVSATSG